jgi:hypothetical protein
MVPGKRSAYSGWYWKCNKWYRKVDLCLTCEVETTNILSKTPIPIDAIGMVMSCLKVVPDNNPKKHSHSHDISSPKSSKRLRIN